MSDHAGYLYGRSNLGGSHNGCGLHLAVSLSLRRSLTVGVPAFGLVRGGGWTRDPIR